MEKINAIYSVIRDCNTIFTTENVDEAIEYWYSMPEFKECEKSELPIITREGDRVRSGFEYYKDNEFFYLGLRTLEFINGKGKEFDPWYDEWIKEDMPVVEIKTI